MRFKDLQEIWLLPKWCHTYLPAQNLPSRGANPHRHRGVWGCFAARGADRGAFKTCTWLFPFFFSLHAGTALKSFCKPIFKLALVRLCFTMQLFSIMTTFYGRLRTKKMPFFAHSLVPANIFVLLKPFSFSVRTVIYCRSEPVVFNVSTAYLFLCHRTCPQSPL